MSIERDKFSSISFFFVSKNKQRLTLIDYDDAMALPNYTDIARLTFDMRGYANFDELRKTFVETYFENKQEQKKFEKFEKLYHLFCCVDWIDFDLKKGYNYDGLLVYFKELITQTVSNHMCQTIFKNKKMNLFYNKVHFLY